MSENQEKYMKTFTCFSGADMVPIIDGEVIGELTAITWEKNLRDGEYGIRPSDAHLIEGKMSAAVFEHNRLEDFEGRKFNVLCYYVNEDGVSMMEYIKGVKLTKVQGGISVDCLNQEVVYDYVAQDIVAVSNPTDLTHQEQLEFVFANDGKRGQQLEVDAYKALIQWKLDSHKLLVIDYSELDELVKERAEKKQAQEESIERQKAALREKAEAERGELDKELAAVKDFEKLSKAVMAHMLSGKAF